MSGKQHQQDGTSHNDTIPTEGLETIFRNKADEELDGQQRYDKGHYITDNQRRKIVHNDFGATVEKQLQHLVSRSSKHSRHSQEERK